MVGRGGACYPTHLKWSAVKDAANRKKFVVGNAAEGEPGVKKDGYILEHYPERIIDGIKIAVDFLRAEKGYIYINSDYHKKFGKKLKRIIGHLPIELFAKPDGSGYIGGEESAVLNAIEGKRIEPRTRPPFPTECGLWGSPTLINNVETFYNVSLVGRGEYKNNRFYTINGDCLWTGVYGLPADHTIEQILKETKNYPNFSFFVQAGGDASGEILNSRQLSVPVGGAGSITVYSAQKWNFSELLKKWIDFFIYESCGRCTPCREGIYRLNEIISSDKPNWKIISDLIDNLNDASFCGLGCAAAVPIKSYIKNVLKNNKKLSDTERVICECL